MRMHVTYVNDIFLSSRIQNFKILWNCVHGAGGQGEVHHVGGGVVQITVYTCL